MTTMSLLDSCLANSSSCSRRKIKTDKIDAGVLAQLYASGFLPEVWIADEATQALRRQVTRRNQIVRQRSPRPNRLSLPSFQATASAKAR